MLIFKPSALILPRSVGCRFATYKYNTRGFWKHSLISARNTKHIPVLKASFEILLLTVLVFWVDRFTVQWLVGWTYRWARKNCINKVGFSGRFVYLKFHLGRNKNSLSHILKLSEMSFISVCNRHYYCIDISRLNKLYWSNCHTFLIWLEIMEIHSYELILLLITKSYP